MTIVFILFLVSLATIGVIVGWYFAVPTAEMRLAETADSLYHIPHVDMIQVQEAMWAYIRIATRWSVIILVVYPLLLIESGARFLSRSIHTVIERRLGYLHNHSTEHDANDTTI